MDVYLLPTRDGKHLLYAGELDRAAARSSAEPEGEPSALRKLWSIGKQGFERVTWTRRQKERLLQSLADLEPVTVRVLYPASMAEEDARAVCRKLVEEQTAEHRKWMTVDAAALPVAVPLSLIPGPNVVLFYLAWRSMTHYRSKKAGEKAAGLSVELVPDDRLRELEALVRRWPFGARRKIRALGERIGLAHLERLY